MTANQYRKALEKLGLSFAKSATALDISQRSSYYYAAGKKPVPEYIAKLLRAMIRLGTIDV
jgi:hypothetical protein